MGQLTMAQNNNLTLQNGDYFGEFSRYKLIFHASHRGTDFDQWLVTDAEIQDELTGAPCIIRQGATIEEVVEGLR